MHTARVVGLSLVCCIIRLITARSQEPELRYRAEQLNCARFLETAEAKILTQSAGRGREQTAGRTGVWQFRAASSDRGVNLVGWLDSLALWRRSSETTITPDTDGLIGGRYRGALSPQGVYASSTRPFIPDEVTEVAGMGTVLDDFFPPLPRGRLRPGQSWSDSIGLTIRRLPDSALSGVPLYRFALETRGRASSAQAQGDTLRVQLRQTSREQGTFVWHPTLGLIRRDRMIVVETTVPPGRSVRQAVRSKIQQRITVERDLTVAPDSGGRCAADPASRSG